ncbi:hypothetical protein D3C71_1331730 [compost metagenome]
MDLFQDAVHRVGDGARHGAVDGAGGRLVLQRTGIGRDAAGGDGTAAQRPQEALVPVGALLIGGFGIGQSTRDTLVGAVDIGIQRFTCLGRQAVLLLPDVLRSRLQGNQVRLGLIADHFQTHRTHDCGNSPGAPCGAIYFSLLAGLQRRRRTGA